MLRPCVRRAVHVVDLVSIGTFSRAGAIGLPQEAILEERVKDNDDVRYVVAMVLLFRVSIQDVVNNLTFFFRSEARRFIDQVFQLDWCFKLLKYLRVGHMRSTKLNERWR